MNGRGDADGSTIDETVRLLARQTAPNEKPGVEFDYSNTGYFLLGVVIARVSGQSLAEFSRAADLRAARHEEHEHRRPLSGRHCRARARLRDRRARAPSSTRPAGSRSATARCTATSTTSRSGTRISTPARSAAASSSQRMYEVGMLNSGHPPATRRGSTSYESRGLTWVTHGGSWVGYRSSIVRVPAEHVSVIVLCNRAEADAGDDRDATSREIFLKRQARPARARRGRGGDRSPSSAAWKPRRPVAITPVPTSARRRTRAACIDQRGGARARGLRRRRGAEARQDRRVRRGRQSTDPPVRAGRRRRRTASSTGRPACAACRSARSRSRSSEIPARSSCGRRAGCGAACRLRRRETDVHADRERLDRRRHGQSRAAGCRAGRRRPDRRGRRARAEARRDRRRRQGPRCSRPASSTSTATTKKACSTCPTRRRS